ncbi:MAG: pesticidal protein Cry7Aa, partial [Patescibacteria group bacterium]
MVTVKNEGIILKKTNLEFENEGVLNPACIQMDGITHMFYRASNHNKVSSIGYCQLKNNKVSKRLREPVLFPEYDYEKKGVEDP